MYHTFYLRDQYQKVYYTHYIASKSAFYTLSVLHVAKPLPEPQLRQLFDATARSDGAAVKVRGPWAPVLFGASGPFAPSSGVDVESDEEMRSKYMPLDD